MTMADKCPFCNGTGYVKQDSMGVSGYTQFPCAYCKGSGNIKYKGTISNMNKCCPYYEEEIFDGVVSQIFCVHPELGIKGEFMCPYGEQYDCDILIHKLNLKRLA